MMKKLNSTLLLGLFVILIGFTCSHGKHSTEMLDRSVVAVPVTGGVMVTWRITGPEYAENATYNLYRGATKIATG